MRLRITSNESVSGRKRTCLREPNRSLQVDRQKDSEKITSREECARLDIVPSQNGNVYGAARNRLGGRGPGRLVSGCHNASRRSSGRPVRGTRKTARLHRGSARAGSKTGGRPATLFQGGTRQVYSRSYRRFTVSALSAQSAHGNLPYPPGNDACLRETGGTSRCSRRRPRRWNGAGAESFSPGDSLSPGDQVVRRCGALRRRFRHEEGASASRGGVLRRERTRAADRAECGIMIRPTCPGRSFYWLISRPPYCHGESLRRRVCFPVPARSVMFSAP